MGMFDQYDSLADNYIPNNIRPTTPPCDKPLQPCFPNRPYVDYNKEGIQEGYWWYYGDTVNLEFNIDGQATFEDGGGNDEPEVDNKITAKQQGSYILPKDFFKDKIIVIQVYNIRQEEMTIDKQLLMKTYGYNDITINEDNSATVNFIIDQTISSKLIRGVYYISLKVLSDTLQDTLFSTSDAVFTVR